MQEILKTDLNVMIYCTSFNNFIDNWKIQYNNNKWHITNHTKCDVFGNIIILMICQSEYKICNMIEQVVP